MIKIDTKTSDRWKKRFEVIFESYNSLSIAQSALKTDTMLVNVIFDPIRFRTSLPKFYVTDGNESYVQLPEIIPGSYDLENVS